MSKKIKPTLGAYKKPNGKIYSKPEEIKQMLGYVVGEGVIVTDASVIKEVGFHGVDEEEIDRKIKSGELNPLNLNQAKESLEKLKPCPHCGINESQVELHPTEWSPKFWIVSCGRCGSHSGINKNKHKVVASWNKRAPQETLQRDLSKEAREVGIRPDEVTYRDLLMNCLNLLERFGSDDELYETPRGAGGQDGYVGCPTGMRKADHMVELIEWVVNHKEKDAADTIEAEFISKNKRIAELEAEIRDLNKAKETKSSDEDKIRQSLLRGNEEINKALEKK